MSKWSDGTTKMVIEAVKDIKQQGSVRGFTKDDMTIKEDELRDALDGITLDEFLRALAVDIDYEEILILLALNEDIEVCEKPVQEIIVVSSDGSRTRYSKD